jgi:fucose 4-O-acetylase-like acetyltransferase
MAEKEFIERDRNLDILRGVGLLCVVLAHVDPPGALFQLRNFDVPLMVLVSGAAFSLRSGESLNYGTYIRRRLRRLVLPTWVFLGFFFTVTFMASGVLNKPFPFSTENMLSSFALLGGINYLWMVRVFVLVAMIAPVAHWAIMRLGNAILFSIILAVVYFGYEVLARSSVFPNSGIAEDLAKKTILYVVPYGVIAALGMQMRVWSLRVRFLLSFIFVCLFMSIALYLFAATNTIVRTQAYKYPPSIYYLSYALGISLFLYGMVEYSRVAYTCLGRILQWIGRRTIWIYLWHISVLYVLAWSGVRVNFVLRFGLVLGTAGVVVVLQEIISSHVSTIANEARMGKAIASVFSEQRCK